MNPSGLPPEPRPSPKLSAPIHATQMRTLKLREVRQLSHSHTAINCARWTWFSGLQPLQPSTGPCWLFLQATQDLGSGVRAKSYGQCPPGCSPETLGFLSHQNSAHTKFKAPPPGAPPTEVRL